MQAVSEYIFVGYIWTKGLTKFVFVVEIVIVASNGKSNKNFLTMRITSKITRHGRHDGNFGGADFSSGNP